MKTTNVNGSGDDTRSPRKEGCTKTASLIGSYGKVEFDIESGFVKSVELDRDFGCKPYKIDVDEWRLRYPGEDMEGEHDVLDFGYWCHKRAKGEDGRRHQVAVYEPPCEDWRKEREEMIAQEKEEL